MEILSNISAFATQGLPKDQWFLRRPDFYCLDASFETASGIISVFNIFEIISFDKQILTFYPMLVPYIYKVIVGLTNLVLYCNIENTDLIDIRGKK